MAPAQHGVATEAAGNHRELYDPPRQRQIGHASPIPAMDTPRSRPARWTHADASGRPDRDDGLITLVARTLYNKPTRHRTGAVECLLHGADSPSIKAPDIPRTASKVSQSQYCRPNDTVSRQWQLGALVGCECSGDFADRVVTCTPEFPPSDSWIDQEQIDAQKRPRFYKDQSVTRRLP